VYKKPILLEQYRVKIKILLIFNLTNLKIIRKIIIIVAIGATFFSCNKTDEVLKQESSPITNVAPEVMVDNGVLVFKSNQSVSKLLSLYNQASLEECVAFEKQLNFISLEHLKSANYNAVEEYIEELFKMGYNKARYSSSGKKWNYSRIPNIYSRFN
jgi:hypothetical protein